MSKRHGRAVSARVRDFCEAYLGEATRFDVVGVMALLLLLLVSDDFWYLRIPATVLAIAGLIHRPWMRTPHFWFLASAVLVIAHVYNWQLVVNHKYLLTYSCLAIGVSRLSADPDRALAANSRLLIGLCFLIATLWKFLSPDFLDGSFLHFTLLTDERFETVARVVGGAAPDIFESNKQAIADLARYDNREGSVLLQGAPGTLSLAHWLTGWTVAVEAAVGLAFLWPGQRGIARLRDVLLPLFLLTTYPIASVLTFGWVLAAMGFAQTPSRVARLSYAAVFVLMPLYDLPFGRLLDGALQRLPVLRGS